MKRPLILTDKPFNEMTQDEFFAVLDSLKRRNKRPEVPVAKPKRKPKTKTDDAGGPLGP